jgi:hypothetical protein
VISHCTDEFAPEKVHATTAEARSRGAVFRQYVTEPTRYPV